MRNDENLKKNLVIQYYEGVSATTICLQNNIPKSTFYTWLKIYKSSSPILGIEVNANSLFKLKQQLEKHKQIISILKSVDCTMSAPLKEKLYALEKLHGQYSVRALCEALEVSRGTFYNHLFRNKKKDTSYQERRDKLSRQKVVSYKISERQSTRLITSAFKNAYEKRIPKNGLVFHSDRGCQYTSNSFQALLKSMGVKQSFSPKSSPQYNAVMESFFSSIKKEELYRNAYHSVQEFKDCIKTYIEFYNITRPHSTLSYKSPNAYEQQYFRLLEINKKQNEGFESH